MKCVHCGQELSDGDMFCAKCGKSQEIAAAGAGFGFRPALDLDMGSTQPEPTSNFPKEDIAEKSLEFAPADTPFEPASLPEEKESHIPPIAPIPVHEAPKPVAPVIPKRKLVNWKVLGCAILAFAVIIGGVYAISEGDLFSDSDSGSSRSRKDRDDHDDDYYNYYNYDDSYDYDDYYDDFDDYDPQPSYFDCPGCTNGWHNLCNGTGTYSNYGYSSDCSCDDGKCNQCGGEGIIYYH